MQVIKQCKQSLSCMASHYLFLIHMKQIKNTILKSTHQIVESALRFFSTFSAWDFYHYFSMVWSKDLCLYRLLFNERCWGENTKGEFFPRSSVCQFCKAMCGHSATLREVVVNGEGKAPGHVPLHGGSAFVPLLPSGGRRNLSKIKGPAGGHGPAPILIL